MDSTPPSALMPSQSPMADRNLRKAVLAVGDHYWMQPGIRSWKQVTADALALLTELDPYRLAPGLPEGAPTDEYAPEADAIARHLISHEAIEVEQIDAIWLHWFDEPLSHVIGAEPAKDLVARLNRLVRASSPTRTEAKTESKNNG